MSIRICGGLNSAGGRYQRGMTLIELLIAIVIISVGLAGVMTVFSTVVKNSADPMVQKNMLAIAEEMMEEIVIKSYTPIANAAPPACGRNTFNDIQDYNGYTTSNFICDADGNQISSLAGYSVNVAVVADAATFSGAGVTATNKITVTVTHGSQNLRLVGWRTNYAS
jgi:MSHA pilin protein MshD